MRIMGLDHGTSTGISILDDGKLFKTHNIRLKTEGDERYIELFNEVKKILEEYKPDIVALETPSHLRNAKILRYLIGLHTAVLMACVELNIKTVDVIPTTMKKFIVGDGRADKSQVAHSLVHKHGFNGKDILIPIYYKTRPNQIKDIIYDIADATALAYYTYCKEI